MKINPVDIVTNNQLSLEKKIYLVSGNEVSFVEKIKTEIVKKFKEAGIGDLKIIKDIGMTNNMSGLFDKNKIYIVDSLLGFNKNILDDLSTKEDVFVFVSMNSSKTNQLKQYFIKNSNSVVVDCYELTKEEKKRILNNYLRECGLEIENSIYWMLIDRLDNKYFYLEKELEKLKFIKKSVIDKDLVERLFSKNSNNSDKIFFELLSSNKNLVRLYNDKITNQNEVSDFYYLFRYFCFMIVNFSDEKDFSRNIPKYLFREKNYLMILYKKFNHNKKVKLLKLLYKTETIIRKNGPLSLILGLRFLLSFRKIITS